MHKIELTLSDTLSLSCDYDLFEKSINKFICRQLDIFDHILTEAEANQMMMSYPVLKSEQADMTQYYQKEKLIRSFLMQLYKKYQVVLCMTDEHFSFENEKEFKKACTRSIREEFRFILHFPELELNLDGGFDLNMGMYFSASNPSGVHIIEQEVEKFKGLYLLGPFPSEEW